jgi:hypothetical protein
MIIHDLPKLFEDFKEKQVTLSCVSIKRLSHWYHIRLGGQPWEIRRIPLFRSTAKTRSQNGEVTIIESILHFFRALIELNVISQTRL